MDARTRMSTRTDRVRNGREGGGKRMSTWKWKYNPEKCDHGVCVGDCDQCDRGDEEEEDGEIH